MRISDWSSDVCSSDLQRGEAFSNEIEPFALKGATLPHDQRRHSQPYLNENQAEVLMNDVLDKYRDLAGVMPARVVVPKTSLYQPDEVAGFRRAAEARVPTGREHV